jgi:hypothetical protein
MPRSVGRPPQALKSVACGFKFWLREQRSFLLTKTVLHPRATDSKACLGPLATHKYFQMISIGRLDLRLGQAWAGGTAWAACVALNTIGLFPGPQEATARPNNQEINTQTHTHT